MIGHETFLFLSTMFVRATALLSFALLLHYSLGRRRVLARSSIWNGCVLALLSLPIAQYALPAIDVECLPAPAPAQANPSTIDIGNTLAHVPSLPEDSRPDTFGADTPIVSESVSTLESRRLPAPAQTPTRRTFTWPEIAAYGYLGGLCLCLIRLFSEGIAVFRFRRECKIIVQSSWTAALAHWQQSLGIRQRISILQSDATTVPVALGWLRPAIVIPSRMIEHATTSEKNAVLIHELAHIHRGDFGWNILLRIVSAIYWPHPFTWIATRIIADTREQAADGQCVHWLGGAETYRDNLLDIASRMTRRPAFALGMAMARSRSSLQRRISWIESATGFARPFQRTPIRAFVCSMLFLLGLFAGTIQLVRAAMPILEAQTEQATGSPLDKLDPKSIPAIERYNWQPPELVAVAGESEGRAWLHFQTMAVSPSGKRIATVDPSDGTLRVWDCDLLVNLASLPKSHGLENNRHSTQSINSVVGVCWTGDNESLATVGGDSAIRTWKFRDGKLFQVQKFAVPQVKDAKGNTRSYVDSVLASRDGRWIISTQWVGRIDVFDMSEGEGSLNSTFVEQQQDLTREKKLGESQDTFPTKGVIDQAIGDTFFIAAGGDGSIRHYPLGKQAASQLLHRFDSPVSKVALSENGQWLAAASAGNYETFRFPRKTKRPGNSTLHSQLRFGKLQEGRWESRRIVEDLDCAMSALAVSPTGKWIAGAQPDGVVRVWNVEGPTPLELQPLRLTLCRGIGVIRFENSDTLVVRGANWRIVRWDLSEQTPTVVASNGKYAGVNSVRFSNDGKSLFTTQNGLEEWNLSAVNAPSKNQVLSLPGDNVERELKFSKDENRFLYRARAGAKSKSLIRFLEKNGKQVKELGTIPEDHSDFWCFDLSPDGKFLVTGTRNGSLESWDLAQKPIKMIQAEKTPSSHHVCDIAFSLDGTNLAIASAASTIHIYDFKDGAFINSANLGGHRGYSRLASFSPDGKTLATGDENGKLILWDCEKWNERSVHEEHTQLVSAARFFVDGKRMVTSARDGSLILRQVSDGKPIKTWKLPGAIWDVAIHPDQKHLAIAYTNGTTYILRLPEKM